MATYNKFEATVEDLAEAKHNFASDQVAIMLSNTAPIATNSIRGDITEITAENGYPQFGIAVTPTSSTQTGGIYKLVLPDTTLNATGNIGPFRYIVIYNLSNSADSYPLICWFDYGSSISLSNGESFLFDFDDTNGLFQLT